MPAPRAFLHIAGPDLWRRCGHDGTALVGDVVGLAWEDVPGDGAVGPAPALAAALAFDARCRLYRSRPELGQLERLRWAAADPLAGGVPAAEPVPLFAPPPELLGGDFAPLAPPTPPAPLGLAVDAAGQLFVGLADAPCVLVYAPDERRLLARHALPGRPLGLAAAGLAVYALHAGPVGLVRLSAHGGVQPLPLPAGCRAPSRIAATADGALFVLDAAGTAAAQVFALAGGAPRALPWATDLVAVRVDDAVELTVARRPGETFRRLRLGADGGEQPPLKARGYDGRGIALTPDGRIVYWTARGPRHAVPARLVYRAQARVVGFRLDGERYGQRWGRVFVEACVPAGARLSLACISADEPVEDAPTVERTPPVNLADDPSRLPPHPEASPPLPPLALLPVQVGGLLHRRADGPPDAFPPPAEGEAVRFVTLEAPVRAAPGRFLWLSLQFEGDTRVTPRVRALRVERDAHDWLERLPRVFAEDAVAADFLRRHLAPFAGLLGEVDARAQARHALLDPAGAPDEVLPWLASFVGLVLDERWPPAARRQLIAEANWLFRYRGTLPGLTRFIELVTGSRALLVEQFRLRGLAAGPLDAEGGAVLGAGLRVGGAIGRSAQPQAGAAEVYRRDAHRFTVIVQAWLDAETAAMLRDLLEVHRPAHTVVTVCGVAGGMRVGVGLHLGLSSLLGPGAAWGGLVLGAATLGRDRVLGRPRPGFDPGASRLGETGHVG